MPYRGSNRDQGLGILQGFLGGQQNKRARQQSAEQSQMNQLQMALMKTQEIRAQEDQKLKEDRQARENADSEIRNQIMQRDSDARVADRTQAAGLEKADYASARMAAKNLLDVHPEVAQDFAASQKFIQSPEGQKMDPAAKALYVKKVTDSIGQKVEALSQQKVQAQYSNVFSTGAAVDDGSPEAEALKATMMDPKVPADKKADALQKYRTKQILTKAKAEHLQLGAQKFEEFLNASGVPQTSQQYLQGLVIRDSIGGDLMTFDQGMQQWAKTMQPKTAQADPAAKVQAYTMEFYKGLIANDQKADPEATLKKATMLAEKLAGTYRDPRFPNADPGFEPQYPNAKPISEDAARAETQVKPKPYSEDKAKKVQEFFANNPSATKADLAEFLKSGTVPIKKPYSDRHGMQTR